MVELLISKTAIEETPATVYSAVMSYYLRRAKECSMADVMLSNDARCSLQSRPPLSHPTPEGGRAGGAGTTFARPLPGKA